MKITPRLALPFRRWPWLRLPFLASLLALPLVAQTYTFSTLAGSAGVSGSADGTGSAARFNFPSGVAVDGSGNVFVADFVNHTIRKITAIGVVTTLAGTVGGQGSADGTGSAARFNNPQGVAVDGNGNVFVADYNNHTIRKITAGGVVTTLAGSAGSNGSTDGTGTAARFNSPGGVAVDGSGNVFVADTRNNTIRKITVGGVVTTLAGSPGVRSDFAPDDGTGSAARFNEPVGVAVDGSGNVFVADSSNRTIRKITAGGVVTTLAGLGGSFGSVDGTGANAKFSNPRGVAVDGAGNVIVADIGLPSIRKVTAGGVVTTLAGLAERPGSADGTGSAARFNDPRGVAVDSSGNVFVADTVNFTIRKGVPSAIGVAPAITTQPTSTIVTLGGTTALTVAATGTTPLTYQWNRNGLPITGATSAIYTLTNATLVRDSGWYQVVVSASTGSTTSTVVFVNVSVSPALVVAWGYNKLGATTVPADLSSIMGLAAGDFHSLALKSDGTVVSWGDNSKGQTVVPANLTNVVSVATGHDHVLALKSDGTVVAWGLNDFNQATLPIGLSNVVRLAGGGSHSVALKSDGTVVAWGRNQDGQASVPAGLANVVGVAAGYYHTVAWRSDGTVVAWGRNDFGQTVVPAGLTNVVSVSAGASHCVALKSDGTVVSWGSNVFGQTAVPAGLNSVLVATAGHQYTLALKADGTAVAWGDNSLGQTSIPSGLTRLVAASAGIYHAVVLRDAADTAAPTITTQPASRSIPVGGGVAFSILAVGTAPLTYQWQKNGANIGNATNATFTLGNVQVADGGSYAVVVSNSLGSVTSAAATLTVNSPPSITTQPANQSVLLGGTATFSVSAQGTAPLGYQWQKNGTAISGATNQTLTIGNGQNADAASYAVVVSNGLGSVTSFLAALTIATVGVAPSIVTQPVSLSVTPGTSATFSVVASGTAPLSYQWSKNGTPVGGATSANLTLSAVQTVNAGNYTVVVTNGSGSVTSSTAVLTVNSGVPPTITAQPGDQSVAAGSTATFSVGVSGTSPFTYQWRLNGAPIPAATNNPLVLPNVSAANAGSYTVVIINTTGPTNSATSSAATLSVIQLPSIATPPIDQSVAAGSNVVFSVVAGGAPPLSYQWSKDGRAIAGAANAVLSLTAVTNNDAGSYSVAVSNGVGTTTSRTVTLVVSPALSKITNVSVRSGAGAGNETLIVGFAIAGQGAGKPVLLRGIGPSLTQFGVPGVLADPELTLYRDAIFLQSNDDWGTSATADQIATTAAATGAFALSRSSKDAALRVVLQPGAYTANVSSRAGTGVALVEVYDADIPAVTRLINVSARSFVDRGAGVLIVGFAIQGNTPKTVLVRGIGPALAAFGVGGTLADPQLVLFKDGSEVVGTNDDWWRGGGATALPPVFLAAGAFGLVSGQADAALIATLPPGSYTAQVKGAGDSTGVALVEVYEVP